MVVYAQLLLKQARALGAGIGQLEVIRSICKVAMDVSYRTEEGPPWLWRMRCETCDHCLTIFLSPISNMPWRKKRAVWLERVNRTTPTQLLALCFKSPTRRKYRAGDKHSSILYLEHIWYVLRMKTAKERRITLDVRPLVQVVENIAGSLGDGVQGNFDGFVELGEMTNESLQLHREIKEYIALMSKDADEWADRQKKRLMEQRKVANQRLNCQKDGTFGRRD